MKRDEPIEACDRPPCKETPHTSLCLLKLQKVRTQYVPRLAVLSAAWRRSSHRTPLVRGDY